MGTNVVGDYQLATTGVNIKPPQHQQQCHLHLHVAGEATKDGAKSTSTEQREAPKPVASLSLSEEDEESLEDEDIDMAELIEAAKRMWRSMRNDVVQRGRLVGRAYRLPMGIEQRQPLTVPSDSCGVGVIIGVEGLPQGGGAKRHDDIAINGDTPWRRTASMEHQHRSRSANSTSLTQSVAATPTGKTMRSRQKASLVTSPAARARQQLLVARRSSHHLLQTTLERQLMRSIAASYGAATGRKKGDFDGNRLPAFMQATPAVFSAIAESPIEGLQQQATINTVSY